MNGAQSEETRMQTQEHVARLCFAGSVGLKLVTGGQNLSNRDHTRQTLTEENRIPETKGSGGKERVGAATRVQYTLCIVQGRQQDTGETHYGLKQGEGISEREDDTSK